MTVQTMSTTELVQSWLRLWNGDDAQAEGLLAPDVRVHAALMQGGDDTAVSGADALVDWIHHTRAALPDLRFTVEVGPIADGEHVVVRWRGVATYGGGFPGATAPVGAPVDFTGTDVLRVRDGRVHEYWVNSDVHVLLAQLGVGA